MLKARRLHASACLWVFVAGAARLSFLARINLFAAARADTAAFLRQVSTTIATILSALIHISFLGHILSGS